MRQCLIAIFLSISAATASAEDLTVVTFNTESDADTSPSFVAQQIRELGDLDVLAVQEVESASALFSYTRAVAEMLGGRWRYVISESGANRTREDDLLGIIYNTEEFRHLATTELHMVRSEDGPGPYGDPRWGLRGVLMVRLLHISSGVEFEVATMHFKCCGAPEIRAHQTEVLARELRSTNRPVILLGDSNIPIAADDTPMSSANQAAFDNLTNGAGLGWAQPSNPMPTQCSGFNSMLDQIYVPASELDMTATDILFPEADFCDGDAAGFADHRPVRAILAGFLTGATDAGTSPVATAVATGDVDDIEEEALRFDRPGDVVAE